MKLKDLLKESELLTEGFTDLLRKFLPNAYDLGDYYYEDEDGVVLLTKTKDLHWSTVEAIENALYDVDYDFIFVDENGKEDPKAKYGTQADIKITSRVNW